MANPSLYYGIIEKPLVTEKSTVLQDIRNQFTFKVRREANKSEIKKAVESLFEVHVEKVRIIRMPGKIKRILGRWDGLLPQVHSRQPPSRDRERRCSKDCRLGCNGR